MSPWLIVFAYSFAAYGACNVIVFGSGPFKIFEFIRNLTSSISEHFGSMFQCMMCLPANFGWICSLVNRFLVKGVNFTPFNIIFNNAENSVMNIILLLLCDGAFTSGIVWLIHNVESFFENIAEGNIQEDDDKIILND